MVLEDGWQAFFNALLRGTSLTPKDIDLVVSSECHFAVNRFQLGSKLSHYFPNAVVITNIEHHAIHRFQAFFGSPFEESAVLTIDNCGEPLRRLGGASLSITLSTAAGTLFRVLEEHKFPECSPGLLYHWFTTFLGFRAGGPWVFLRTVRNRVTGLSFQSSSLMRTGRFAFSRVQTCALHSTISEQNLDCPELRSFPCTTMLLRPVKCC
jgi:hypothetical protein